MARPVGKEIKKDRPWVLVSPDSINGSETTLMVVPLSQGAHPYPYRVACAFGGRSSHIILDQIKTVHWRRVRRRLGAISPQALRATLAGLREMFAE